MKSFFHKTSVTALASAFMLGSLLCQKSEARYYRPLHARQSDWIEVYLEAGNHLIVAETFLGDIDLKLYDATGKQQLASAEQFGNDRMNITVHRSGNFLVKYSMPTCFNPFGSCVADIYFSRPQ